MNQWKIFPFKTASDKRLYIYQDGALILVLMGESATQNIA